MAKAKQKAERVWMGWSPDSNYLPQAASVDRGVCQEMVKARGWSNRVKVVRVLVSPIRRKRDPQ